MKRSLPRYNLSKLFLAALCVIFLILPLCVMGQRTCGTPQAIKEALQKHPKLIEKYQQLQQLTLSQPMNYLRGKPVAVIPVVVHIVLTNPNSITEAQVQSQINVLNQDYADENPDRDRVPDVWEALIGDMKIQFCLAERTPAGNPANGVERIKTERQRFSINNAASEVKHAATGGADAWDPDKYLNIWVCNLGGNDLGVGTPPGLYPHDEDGVVIQYNAFGTTGNVLPAFNKGRSCTHEIGHYFNLLHLWGSGDGSCSPGDHVDDTPPQSEPVYECPQFPYLDDPCSPAFPGVMFMNFMGYANDSCMEMFTKGQVEKAQAALFKLRAGLLTSDGCKPVNLQNDDARLRSVLSPKNKICSPGIIPVVTLENFGKKQLTTVNIFYQVDDGEVKKYEWEGSLNTLDSVQITLPASTVPTGSHQLTVYTSMPNGQTDNKRTNDTATARFHLDPLATTPFHEGFEQNDFPPPGWVIHNPDKSFTWQKTSTAAHSGKYSVMMKNLDYAQNGPADDLVTPVFDVQNADSAFLFFYVAAGIQSDPNGNNQYWDTLEVLISNDCAQTGTLLYKKWNKNLITDTVPTAREFVPSSTEWRRDSINLTPYLNRGNFQIIFRNITNFENNIYLDDIQLITKQTNPILEKEKVLVVPNPATDQLNVQFLGNPPELKSVAIYNALGQLIFRKSASAVNTQNRIEFNLANEPNGVYFVKIFYTDHEVVKKIIKLK